MELSYLAVRKALQKNIMKKEKMDLLDEFLEDLKNEKRKIEDFNFKKVLQKLEIQHGTIKQIFEDAQKIDISEYIDKGIEMSLDEDSMRKSLLKKEYSKKIIDEILEKKLSKDVWTKKDAKTTEKMQKLFIKKEKEEKTFEEKEPEKLKTKEAQKDEEEKTEEKDNKEKKDKEDSKKDDETKEKHINDYDTVFDEVYNMIKKEEKIKLSQLSSKLKIEKKN